MADMQTALWRYANHAPLDLKSPSEIQRDLLAIAGTPHIHVAGHSDGLHIDECALCGQDIHCKIHNSKTEAIDG